MVEPGQVSAQGTIVPPTGACELYGNELRNPSFQMVAQSVLVQALTALLEVVLVTV